MGEMAERQQIIPDAAVRPIRRGGPKREVSLALQGGGSFGAFTWGVLDRLLEEERIVLGYSVNPPLRAPVAESKADDVLLMQLTPADYEGAPRAAPEIARRVGQIVFNQALHGCADEPRQFHL
jgi:hypothetical protein